MARTRTLAAALLAPTALTWLPTSTLARWQSTEVVLWLAEFRMVAVVVVGRTECTWEVEQVVLLAALRALATAQLQARAMARHLAQATVQLLVRHTARLRIRVMVRHQVQGMDRPRAQATARAQFPMDPHLVAAHSCVNVRLAIRADTARIVTRVHRVLASTEANARLKEVHLFVNARRVTRVKCKTKKTQFLPVISYFNDFISNLAKV